MGPEDVARSVASVSRPLLQETVLARTEGRFVAATDTDEHAPGDGIWSFSYGPAETVSISPPAGRERLPSALAAELGDRRVPAPSVAVVPDAAIVGRNGTVFTSDDRLVLESLPEGRRTPSRPIGRRSVYDELLTERALRGSRSGTLSRPVCPLTNEWSSGYFHWMYDCLTKIEGVERYEDRTDVRPTLLVGPDPPRWQLETLEILGWGDDWIQWNGGRVSADTVLLPSLRRVGNVFSERAITWLRDRFADAIADADVDLGPRIYVSRSDADRRRVLNEGAVVDMLEGYGFERVVPSEHSVAEQAAIFSNATTVVGPHGAGFVNLLFATDVGLLELFGDMIGECYFTMCEILGHEYDWLVGEPDDADFRVDTDELEDAIPRVLDTKP